MTKQRQRLTEIERKVLAYFSIAAKSPVTEAAKVLKERVHSLRYALDSLRSRRVIVGEAAYLNVYPIGIITTGVFFNAEATPGVAHDRLIKQLTEIDGLSWLARVGGSYQFAAALRSRSFHHLHTQLEALGDFGNGAIRERVISQRRSTRLYGRRYLFPTLPVRSPLWSGPVNGPAPKLDDDDHKLMAALALGKSQSSIDIARGLNASVATINRRIAALEKAKLLQGFVTQIAAEALGVRAYRLLLKQRGAASSARKAIEGFVERHKEVTQLDYTFGEWDFELEIEAVNAAGIDAIRTSILNECGAVIARAELIEVFEHLYFNPFPFRTG